MLRLLSLSFLIAICTTAVCRADLLQTEAHELGVGWNAIWLETTPVDANGDLVDPATLFTSHPTITFAATPSVPFSSSEFIANPNEAGFNEAEWDVWRATDESGGYTLGVMLGGRGYLIHTTAATTLTFTGEAAFNPPSWQADAYNLRGFRIDESKSLTFADLFDPVSDIFPVNQIFQLQADGKWTGITSSDLVVSGEAYWIRCNAFSTYMGPVHLQIGDDEEINFGTGLGSDLITVPPGGSSTLDCSIEEIQLQNRTTSPQPILFTRLDDESDLRLFETQIASSNIAFEGTEIAASGGTIDPGSLGSEAITQVRLAANRNWTTPPTQRAALLDANLGGVLYYIPLRAGNNFVEITSSGTTSSTFTGLWAGTVVLDAVSSLTETGQPVADTTSQLPMPIFLHVDSGGSVNLLSQVVLMQTKATSTDEVPEPVLVINPERIPYFDGIEERQGRLTGIRLQSAGYDMPRVLDTTTQSALQQEVFDLDTTGAYSDVSDVTIGDLRAFLAGQSVRPTTLVEDYHLKWPMTGALQPGGSIATASPLRLDPFHRSNPFRHAFHTQHFAGFEIAREIFLTFEEGSSSDSLTGLYQEKISGLAQPDAAVASGTQSSAKTITIQGTVLLRRVAPVGELQE